MSKQVKCDICGSVRREARTTHELISAVPLEKPIVSNAGTETHDYYLITISKICTVDDSGYGGHYDEIDVCMPCLITLIQHTHCDK